MLSDELCARLALLDRARLAPAVPLAHNSSSAFQDPISSTADGVSLEELVPGQVLESERGSCWLIRRELSEIWPQAAVRLAREPSISTASIEANESAGHPELELLRTLIPDRVLFLDLETCGFAGSPLFLLGMVRHMSSGLVIEQLLARDYTEEPALLWAFWRLMEASPAMVTFNGKSFDWPMLRDRSTYHGLPCTGQLAANSSPGGMVHIDLLHHARRSWRHRLPNCRLQTLEWFICRRLRRDDVPGSMIGHEYHQFVRHGDSRRMKDIVHHNALDLVTLVELAARLAAGSSA